MHFYLENLLPSEAVLTYHQCDMNLVNALKVEQPHATIGIDFFHLFTIIVLVIRGLKYQFTIKSI